MSPEDREFADKVASFIHELDQTALAYDTPRETLLAVLVAGLRAARDGRFFAETLGKVLSGAPPEAIEQLRTAALALLHAEKKEETLLS